MSHLTRAVRPHELKKGDWLIINHGDGYCLEILSVAHQPDLHTVTLRKLNPLDPLTLQFKTDCVVRIVNRAGAQ